jgi:hypothetical protein
LQQARLYFNQINPLTRACGPTQPAALPASLEMAGKETDNEETSQAQSPAASVLSVQSRTATAGSTINVNVNVTAQGNETQYGFVLNFNPALLTFTGNAGAGTTGATSASCNLTATAGQIFCAVTGFPNNLAGTNPAFTEIATGLNTLISPQFVVANTAGGMVANVTITDASAANEAAQPQVVTTAPGTVTISASTAPAVPVLDVDEETAGAGSSVPVDVRVSPIGNETQFGFALDYNTTLLTFTGFANGDTGATQNLCNVTATPGRIFCSVGSFPVNQVGGPIGEISSTPNQVLIRPIFTIAAGTLPGTVIPLLISNPDASDENSNTITPIGLPGSITVLAPTAADTSLSGRIISSRGGIGLVGVLVTLLDISTGETFTTVTDSEGFYRFGNAEAGNTYIITPSLRGYSFTERSKSLSITEDTSGIDFTAIASGKTKRSVFR